MESTDGLSGRGIHDLLEIIYKSVPCGSVPVGRSGHWQKLYNLPQKNKKIPSFSKEPTVTKNCNYA